MIIISVKASFSPSNVQKSIDILAKLQTSSIGLPGCEIYEIYVQTI